MKHLLHLHRRHRWATHGLFWVAILLLATLDRRFGSDTPSDSFADALVVEAVSLLPRIAIAYWLVYIILPRFWERKQYVASLALGVVGLYALYVATIGLRIWVSSLTGWLFTDMQSVGEVFRQPVGAFGRFVLSNLGGTGGLLLVRLLLHQGEAQQRALQLEKQKTELELTLLKAQLNPHFLFNTLNNLYALATLQSPNTAASIARLADMLDYMLYRCNARLVPLSGEVTLLRNYLALEQLRYDDRLQLRFGTDIDPQTMIAPLLLLSVVENAFKHGASEAIDTPHISIDLQAKNGSVRFRTTNSYVPTHATDGGLGLPNLRQQLALLYPDQHTLTLSQTDALFVVDLTLTPSIAYENPVPTR